MAIVTIILIALLVSAFFFLLGWRFPRLTLFLEMLCSFFNAM